MEAAGDDAPVYLLTGTPLANRPRDLFPLLQVAGHSLGRSFLRRPDLVEKLELDHEQRRLLDEFLEEQGDPERA